VIATTNGNQSSRKPLDRVAQWLGFAGLLPFYGALLILMVADADLAAPAWRALIGYGVVILTFLGAVHWGVAIASDRITESAAVRMLAWGVLPSLMAWAVLLLGLTPGPALLVLAAGFSAQFGADRRLGRTESVPAWYLILRGRLTMAVLVCLAIAFVLAPRSA
jgi:hypothetical protein